MELDVCLCTHNPRPDVLALALASLAGQSVRAGTFRLTLVDSASDPAISDRVLGPVRAAGFEARLTREAEPGLMHARWHASEVTTAPWVLFLDDDNELTENFISEGIAFIKVRPRVGCFGGKLLLPSTVPVPQWAAPYLTYLAIRDVGEDVIEGAANHWGIWEPPGAGMWIRRDQLDAFRARLLSDPRAFLLDRVGRRGVGSCGDSLMARESLGLGLLNAYNPRLRLRHHLDPSRLRLSYLLRLMHGYANSHVLLESVLCADSGGSVVIPDCYASLSAFVRMLIADLNEARRQSWRFALGQLTYYVSVRRAYHRHQRRHTSGGAARASAVLRADEAGN